ncbi:hypothetical protein BDY17DRAFT_305381 [Neohortaea acidophila]|uniref:Uncharacterized protein n=1 Tax=Neohortaea acidophila TaxID=245834 RepID=A0A6A6PHQ5_9PEZI|nr:uncharacterized protein BDY17DRAFT_305381 [Neohortaea acidophila]KAF2479316.1 hypothetical protein BDY17DRAFT_305381 [Neohortaea acidophila]
MSSTAANPTTKTGLISLRCIETFDRTIDQGILYVQSKSSIIDSSSVLVGLEVVILMVARRSSLPTDNRKQRHGPDVRSSQLPWPTSAGARLLRQNGFHDLASCGTRHGCSCQRQLSDRLATPTAAKQDRRTCRRRCSGLARYSPRCEQLAGGRHGT